MIVPASSTDVEVITAIELACFGLQAWGEALVRAEVEADHRTVLMHGPDAYGAVSVAGDVADLDRIAVMPSHRRSGLARSLLDALVGAARERDCARMLLEVAADNAAAIGLYQAYGFTIINRRTGYYRDGVDALVMQLEIEESP